MFVHVSDVAEAIVKALEKEDNIGEKYLIGKHYVTFKEMGELVCRIAGVPLPRFRMSDTLAIFNALVLTMLANITKKPPRWGMSID